MCIYDDGKVQFSEDGCNMKAKEMATYMLFAEYLEDCAGLYWALCMHNAVQLCDVIAVNMQ